MIGAGCDLHTEVERKTRFLMAGIVPGRTAGELREIVDEADNRPMRVLDYRTPAEAFADELLELQDQQGGVAPLNRHRAHGLRGGEQ